MLFHIATETDVKAARLTGEYKPPAFSADGFIHCSHLWQVTQVANRLFRGRNDLVLLEIDPSRLTCRVIEENLEGGIELFPHIYGALPLDAVARVRRFPCRDDGGFTLPGEIGT